MWGVVMFSVPPEGSRKMDAIHLFQPIWSSVFGNATMSICS